MCFAIAIVGRPNVGKTTIFNRFVGAKRSSIVENIIGVTRDRNEVIANFYDIKANFIDIAGIELRAKKDIISQQMQQQALNGIIKADVCLLVIDGILGVVEKDIEVLNIIRKYNKPVIVLINKCENLDKINQENFYKINVDDKILISAQHNIGFADLYKVLLEKYNNWFKVNQKQLESNKEQDKIKEHKIRIAVLGRPNAGKSTFLNNLLQENRLITSDIAGTTRDKIEIDCKYGNREFVLIDTAGIRKKYKNGECLEAMAVEKSLEALQFADVAIMISDITKALEEQDLSLCQKICEEGRILVVCFNKWDLVDRKKEYEVLKYVKAIIQQSIAQVKGIVFFTCSSLKDDNLTDILQNIIVLYDKWSKKLSSGTINKAILMAKRKPNSVINQLKIKYITQIKSRPPTFIAFSGKKEKDILINNIESLKNWIYQELDYAGVSIRVSIRGKK